MTHMSQVDAVIFDMDGILIDSEVIWRQVREEFAAEHGLVWDAALQVSCMGCSSSTWARIMVDELQLKPRLGLDEDGIAREIKRRLLEKFRQQLPEREGAVAAVKLAASRYPVALATGSPVELASFVMQATGLDRVFVASVYGDDVEHGKPAPDIYLAALKKLGVAPERAVGVEDSANGIRSLRSAGMAIVAAPGPEFPLDANILALADVQIGAMTELSLGVIQAAGQAAAARR